MPTTAEMFADAQTAAERADQLEALKAALAKSVQRQASKVDAFEPKRGIIKGGGSGHAERMQRIMAAAERMSRFTKDLSADEASEVRAELDALNALKDDLAKDITVTTPGNLHPYDLEAPAKILVPRFTPLRNRMGRQKGQGTAREYRRILGYTNTGMGGVADQTPFFNSESDSGAPTFGQLALRRGQKISYAMDVKTANYVEMSLSDLVTWKAQFTDLGFEDVRSLSQMALLWAHLLGEEKAILWGRGASGSGYEGAVAAPAISSLASAGSGTGSGFGTTAFVKVTSYTGMGESAASAEVNSTTLTAGRPLQINLTSQPTGALLYGVYVGTTTGSETFQGFFSPVAGQTNQIQVNVSVTGGRVAPSTDASFSANGYDGYLSVLTDPAQAGYFARYDQTYSSGVSTLGDQPWQDAFASLFASVYADPDEVWVAAPQRRALADFLRKAANGTAGYRITLTQDEANHATVGAMVDGLMNESSPTGRVVDLYVHPYMPSGCSFINSRTLPIPDSHISETAVMTEVQGYMSVDWEPIQFTYDASTYWYGTLVHYAPKWSGAIVGLQ